MKMVKGVIAFVMSVITALILQICFVAAVTDPVDLQALEVMYTSLNSPSQLTGWKANGGDPCSELWKGVMCEGSSVVSIEISGLGLNGTMGYMLNALKSLKILDMSSNSIHDSIPYQLPPNLTTLNLAYNNLSGTIPYSITDIVSINYLNLSGNSLYQSIGDVFTNHSNLVTLDLSFNNFSGDLPTSLSSLSSLSTLYLQNNRLAGTLDVLASLPLTDLNVANNNFSGLIPNELISVPNFAYDGNSFANSPAPTSPPPSNSQSSQSHIPPVLHKAHRSDSKPINLDKHGKKGLSSGAVTGIILGSLSLFLFAIFALLFCLRKHKRKNNTATGPSTVNGKVLEQRAKPAAPVLELKPLPMEKMTLDRSVKRVNSITSVTPYSVAALQTATNSFSQESLVGEGSFGRVYRADFPNGKILAVKKIDSAVSQLQEEDDFLEVVKKMSRLRHTNIVPLVGYCAEHSQRLLVFDYVRNGSLHDMLHLTDERSKTLTWNARVKVALGTARALEYLHEVCQPSVVHQNFKSANILLDDDLNPQLSDCGLAALTTHKEQVSSTQNVGSFGYSAPEFVLSGTYTVKSDVYSFGVVMLELLTGREPFDNSRARSEQSLVRWAMPQLHDIDALAKMVDPSLNGMYPAKSLSRFADIIAICVQTEPEFRPPMSEVVQALVRLVQGASVVRRQFGDESGSRFD